MVEVNNGIAIHKMLSLKMIYDINAAKERHGTSVKNKLKMGIVRSLSPTIMLSNMSIASLENNSKSWENCKCKIIPVIEEQLLVEVAKSINNNSEIIPITQNNVKPPAGNGTLTRNCYHRRVF